MSGIEDSINNCWRDVEDLRSSGRIKRVTSRMLKWRIGAYEDAYRAIHRYDSGQRTEDLRGLSREIIELEHVIGQLTQCREKTWERFSLLFDELLPVLFPEMDGRVDFFVTSSLHDTIRLKCMHSREHDSCCFILIAGTRCDYQDNDLLPLMAHEVAHMLPDIDRFVVSYYPSMAKKGEMLADYVGFVTSGPSFVHAVSHYISKVVGVAQSQRIPPRHPSWACRASVLRFANRDMWESKTIISWAERHLATLDGLALEVPPAEDVTHAESLREIASLRTHLARFKISEGGLRSIAQGNEPRDAEVMMLNAHAHRAVS